MKKAISLGVAAAMAATLLAGCGTAASSAAPSSEAASTADSTTAESTAASEAAPSEAHEINTTDPIELTISWWGGDSRHEAYQKALEAFHEKYPNITVSPTYGAWSGWEEKQSTALAADQGSDVMQVNWNWLYQYSPTGEKFVDLREYSDIIDLSQWSDTAKNACIVADSLQAVPISMTGRIFYWNMNTFKQAGIEAVPTSYDDLIAAGKLNASIELVVSSRPSAKGLQRAERAGIQTLTLSKDVYADPIAADEIIAHELLERGCEYVVMAGYMRMVHTPLLAAFPNRVVNLHPALLPSFTGAHAIDDAFARGVKVTGVTVHFANEIYDNGPIIAQRALAVEEGWDVDTLEEHIHAIEHVLYPEVVQMLADGRVHVLESGKVAIDAPRG